MKDRTEAEDLKAEGRPPKHDAGHITGRAPLTVTAGLNAKTDKATRS